MGKIAAIVLAAGKGKRMALQGKNKVSLLLAGKPMIMHCVEFLEDLGINPIVVVVGHAKESVVESLDGKTVIYAHQENQLGTAHAVDVGLKVLSSEISTILVVQGDDSAFYNKKNIKNVANLLKKHESSNAKLTFLTVEMENPTGLGRVIRSNDGMLVAITEEKNADEKERLVLEINPACYVFERAFLEKYLPQIEKNEIAGEYYLTDIIDVALKHKEKIETLQAGRIPWRGVNTKEEFEEANRLLVQSV